MSGPGGGRRAGWPAILAGGLGVALFLALAGTEFHVVPQAAGAWRGLIDPPGWPRLGLALAGGVLAALALRRAAAAVARPLAWLALARCTL